MTQSIPRPSVQRIPFKLDQLVPGSLDVQWIHGSISAKHNTDPDIQVHAYNEHTYILRQNKAVSFEAPFMYLFLGNDRAMLIDTGATESPEFFPLRATVDQIIDQWLLQHPREHYEMIVAHTHLHLDHFMADEQFSDRPHTQVVGLSLEATQAFYGFTHWPHEIIDFDLGDRILKIMGSPGHEAAEVSIYDTYTGILVTGDIFYPGRLYVEDWEAFQDSIERLIVFTETHPISHVMGCHVEMSRTPGKDYKRRTTYQPNEVPPQMTVAQLKSVRKAIAEINGQFGIHVFSDYIIFNGIPDGYFED
jgi:glyoxylase-like metal-dependent hydrolase (beta-lactamase superfamily II)